MAVHDVIWRSCKWLSMMLYGEAANGCPWCYTEKLQMAVHDVIRRSCKWVSMKLYGEAANGCPWSYTEKLQMAVHDVIRRRCKWLSMMLYREASILWTCVYITHCQYCIIQELPLSLPQRITVVGINYSCYFPLNVYINSPANISVCITKP
jgi:hypothetical protein